MDPRTIRREDLQALFDALVASGYEPIGPTARDGAIVYEPISRVEDLPLGWTDSQEAGSYRLQRRDDEACFAYAVGPQSWKRYLQPAELRLWSAERRDGAFRVQPEECRAPRYAFIGVRACELAAIAALDRALIGEGPARDSSYQAVRERAFIVLVQCGHPARTCFCASMGTGPRAGAGFDLALTEICEPPRHVFVAEAGSERGRELLAGLPCAAAPPEDLEAAQRVTDQAAARMGRRLDAGGAKDLLYRSADSPVWDSIAERCLACANCTLVCPTCFCTTVEDVSDLSGDHAERWRRWDSCYSLDFSRLHGGSVRASIASRYRQWLTHKLAYWHDQFGRSGCVGCGRCIAWCPVGIDLTAELPRFAGSGERPPAPEE
jgi:ferredoxin